MSFIAALTNEVWRIHRRKLSIRQRRFVIRAAKGGMVNPYDIEIAMRESL